MIKENNKRIEKRQIQKEDERRHLVLDYQKRQ